MIEKFLIELEDSVEQIEKRRDAIRKLLNDNDEAFDLLMEYKKQMLSDIENLEEDIYELKEELSIIRLREKKCIE